MHKSRKRNQQLKPWLIDVILGNTEPKKAQSVKVLKHIEGPKDDGSVIREVTDGNVFIKAVFSKDALIEMLYEEGSTEPEWYNALLVIKKYSTSFDVRNSLERSEFILKIDSASIWDLQQGFYLKYKVTDCMDDENVKSLAKEMFENCKMPQNRNETMDHSIPLTQLMGNMSYLESQSQTVQDPDVSSELSRPFDIKEFLIPAEQKVILDSIAEWKTDYVPSHEDFSQESLPRSRQQSHREKDLKEQCADSNKRDRPLVIKECLIPSQQKAALDGIPEWKTDYVPSHEDFSQESLPRSKQQSHRDNIADKDQVEQCADPNKRDREALERLISNNDEMICSGESIKLSCSDFSEDDVHKHGDDLSPPVIVEVSSSSGGDNSQENTTELNKKTSDAYQRQFEQFVFDEDSVTSTVHNFPETQPFEPNISPITKQLRSPNSTSSLIETETQPFLPNITPTSEPFSPKMVDPLLSDVSDTNIQGSKHSADDTKTGHEAPCRRQSDQSVIDDTPEEDRLKTLKVGKDLNSPRGNLPKSLNVDGTMSSEHVKCKYVQKSEDVNKLEIAEELRLNMLSCASDELSLQTLDKSLSGVTDNLLLGKPTNIKAFGKDLSKAEKSVSDNTLLNISSGQMKDSVNNGSKNSNNSDSPVYKYTSSQTVDRSLVNQFIPSECTPISPDNSTIDDTNGRNEISKNLQSFDAEKISVSDIQKTGKRNRPPSFETEEKLSKCRKQETDTQKLYICEPVSNVDCDEMNCEQSERVESGTALKKLTENIDHDQSNCQKLSVKDKHNTNMEIDFPDSESLLKEKSVSKNKSDAPLAQRQEKSHEVIVISSGDSVECPGTSARSDNDSGEKGSVEVLHYRQRNPCTESEDIPTPGISKNMGNVKNNSNQASDNLTLPCKKSFKFKKIDKEKPASINPAEKVTESRISGENRIVIDISKTNSHIIDNKQSSKLSSDTLLESQESSYTKHTGNKSCADKSKSEMTDIRPSTSAQHDVIRLDISSLRDVSMDIAEYGSDSNKQKSGSTQPHNNKYELPSCSKDHQIISHDPLTISYEESQSLLEQNVNNVKQKQQTENTEMKTTIRNTLNMEEFLMSIKPKTDIGKKLLKVTVPPDLVLSAFNYYRNK